MGVIKIIDNEDMSLFYLEEQKIVHHKMKKNLKDEQFELLLSTGAEYMEKYRAKKWLSDDRDNAVISKEANEWGDKVWAPRAIKAGFKFWAIVIPSKSSAKLQMTMFASEYKKRGVTVQIFEDVDNAIKWLESCE